MTLNFFKLSNPTKYGRRLAGFVTTTYRLLILGFIWNILTILWCLYRVFVDKLSVPVYTLSKESKVFEDLYTLKPLKNISLLQIHHPNLVDFLFLNFGLTKNSLISLSISLLVIIQLIKIFKSLDVFALFSFQLAAHIKTLGKIYILSFALTVLQLFYITYKVKDVVGKGFKLESSLINNSFSSLFVGLILLVIAAIYKKACLIQEEQQLTV